MPLITQWVKERFSTASVYIPREADTSPIYRASYCPERLDAPLFKMPSSKSEPNSPERGGGDQASPLSIRLPGFARYNLWPKPKKSPPVEPTTPYTTTASSAQQRSPSSLSDHAVS